MDIIGDVLEEVKKIKNCSQNIIFSDPPYNLGSKWEINNNFKPEIKGNAVDFMNKNWKGLSGSYLEIMFQEFFRILKFGGFCVFSGQMRQALPFIYYAINANFEIIESVYSFSIANFPKAMNVSKNLKKFLDKVDKEKNKFYSTDLIKKYNGIKSSISPFKQTTEVWFIFRKPFKNKTIIKDIIAYENGDKQIHPSGLNIKNGRVPDSQGRYPAQLFLDGSILYTKEEIKRLLNEFPYSYNFNKEFIDLLYFVGIDLDCLKYMENEKRINYICSYLEKFNPKFLLDQQSGILESGTNCVRTKSSDGYHGGPGKAGDKQISYGDKGRCSRVLHNSSFVLEELCQHIFYSKPSKYEKNAGCEDLVSRKRFGKGNYSQSPICSICKKTINGTNNHSECEKNKNYKIDYVRKEKNDIQKNNHPTLKSLKLLYNIITLLITVEKKKTKILIPFAGTYSEKIAWLAHGISENNITTIEKNIDYTVIGKKRTSFWIKNNFFFKEDKKNQEKIKRNIIK